MGTPDERGKRTWRFRLNDTSILEVSTPPRATEKQVRRRGRWSLIFGTLIASLSVGAVLAYADDLNVTNDLVLNTASETKAPGTTGTLYVYLAVAEPDSQNGCNATGSSPMTVGVTSGDPSRVTINSPGTVTLAGCGSPTAQPIEYSVLSGAAPGNVTITAAYVSGGRGQPGATNNSDTFTVSISSPPPSDTTAPDISYVLSPASPDGNNGWYKTNVTLTWTVTENESPSSLVKTGCVDQSITGDQQEQTYSCSATSDGGSAGPVEVKIKRDATAPSITRDASADTCSLPGDNGWCRGSQTAGFTASDATSGIAPVGTSPIAFTQSTTTNGSAVSIPSGTRFDMAGNESNSLNAGPFKLDSLKPLNTVTGVANGQTYTLGSVPAAGCSTEDQGSDNSGVAVIATLSVTGGTVNGVGTFVAKCGGGKDNAGNTADDASVMYSVHFGGLSGILQPINPDNSSVFSRGKAVPVKFRLAGDEYTGFNVSGWTLKQQQTSCTVDGDPVGGEVEPVVENPSNGFRYDASADQYIYNANFKDKTVGTCWKVVVTLDSGQKLESAVFKLQK